MSRGVNKVILVGNLGKDPEVRYANNGNAIANLSVATSDEWKDKNTGEKQERTEWHRVVLFGKLAEIAGQYLRKGSQVYLEGRLQTRKWTGQDGNERYTTEVVVDQRGVMQMLSGINGNGSQQTAQQGSQQAAPQQQQMMAQQQSQPIHHQAQAAPNQMANAQPQMGQQQMPQQPAVNNAGVSPNAFNPANPASAGGAFSDFESDDVPF